MPMYTADELKIFNIIGVDPFQFLNISVLNYFDT